MGGETPPLLAGREVNKWFDHSGELGGRAFSCENLRWLDWRGAGVFVFSIGGHEVRVWPEANASPEAIVQTFFRMLQPLILQALGWQALHAGATVGPKGVLAFCGKSGCGKSTLAFGMRQVGWRQFSDDALVLRLDADRVLACPLPFTPRLRPRSRTHFAQTRSNLVSCAGGELTEVPLTAVFLLRQDHGLASPRVSLMPQARAFSQLLAHAHCFDAEDPKHARRLVDNYLALSAHVPVFSLDYCPEFQYLPQVTRAIAEAAENIAVPAKLRSAPMLPWAH
jgi:hypothetical protein